MKPDCGWVMMPLTKQCPGPLWEVTGYHDATMVNIGHLELNFLLEAPEIILYMQSPQHITWHMVRS